MKQITLYTLIVILSCTALWKAYSLGTKSSMDSVSKDVNIIYDDFDADAISKLSIGLRIDTNETVENYKKDKITIGKIASSYDVIARFSASGCKPCIDTLMDRIMKLHTNHRNYRIALIISNIPYRDIYVGSQQYNDEIDFFKADSLSCDISSSFESPYIFQIDQSGKITSHFVCRYGDTEELDKYIESILNK